MAGLLLCVTRILFLFLVNLIFVSSNPVNKPVQNVPEPLIQSALSSLNQDSPTHHTYQGGNLISAQKLEESPYVIYRLTFDLTPTCNEALEPCPREACTIEVKQHELGDIEVSKESIQCMYLYPQSTQDDLSQGHNQDQEQIIESLDKQITNQSIELDHEIQKNGDRNDRPFIAVRASNPKYCPGCPYELNPNLPGLAAFGEQTVRLLDESIQNDFKHKVVEIAKVFRAVPPSSNAIQYQILFYIGESNCLKNEIEQKEICALQANRPIKVCLVTFEEEPWEPSSRRITKNNCTTDNNVEEAKHSYSLLNSEALTAESKKGETNTEKLEALENLKETLDNYTYATPTKSEVSEQSEVTEHPILRVSLNRSDDDVVDVQEFKDKTKEFGEFLRDFDLPVREIHSNPETTKEEVKEEIIYPKKVDSKINESKTLLRKKRSKNLVGAPSRTNVNDPEILEFAQKGLKKFSENSEGSNEPMIVQIVEASKQVVSGMLYKIRIKLGTSNCPKGTKNNCQLKEGSEIKECLFDIWSQPWLDNGSPKITINCDLNNRRKRSLKGSRYSQTMLKLAEEMKHETLFEDFIKKFDKSYHSPEEKQNRLKIFRENLDLIKKLQIFERGTAEYGITMFADLTPKEFKARFLGYRPELKQENEIPLVHAKIEDIPIPPKFDWREHGVVTPVKNQESCGSCWAFSVTGNVEGQYAIKHGKLLSLSEQELVDCDTLDEGCSGGLMENAYEAIERLGGLELESDYPYEGENEKCNFKVNEAKVQVVSAVNITSNETKMAQWLVQNGPISIAINANAMQFYFGGVSHPMSFLCNPKDLDHGVLIVGYGTSKYPLFHKELPYWIIKNSWGSDWGERGYYRVYRGDGTCGLNKDATSAIVA